MTKLTSIYKGKIIAVDSQNRARVRVKGIFDEIPDSNIPWARQQSAAVSGGQSLPPVKGAKVSVRFLDGDINFPVWMGGVVESAADLPKNAKDGRYVIYESPDKRITIAINETLGDIEIKTARFNTTLENLIDLFLSHTQMTPAGISGNVSTGVPPIVALNFKAGKLI